MMSFVKLEREGPIGIVALRRPERLNAMSRALTRDAEAAFRQANADPEIAVIVFTGTGRAFCAGDDLKEFGEQSAGPASIKDHVEGIQAVTRAIMFSDKVIVGAIHGYAVGGGFEWLCNCDMVVAADDLVAFFPEMDWAQFVTGAVTHLLPQAIGYQRAMRLMVLGERQSAHDLEALGLVGWVVPRDAMLPKAMEIASAVAAKSRYSVGKLKRLLVQGLDDRLERALRLEGEITETAFGRSEAAERVRRFGERSAARPSKSLAGGPIDGPADPVGPR
jgi:enoyl-CoA hydratase/carnithine racemase